MITTGQPRRAAIPSVDLYTTGAPGAYTTADVEPPSSRDAAWGRGGGIIAADMHRGMWKACRKPSENQAISSTLAARVTALSLACPPPLSPPGEVAAPCRRACGRRALRTARRLSRLLV